MNRRLVWNLAAAVASGMALALVWWGWHQLDASLLLFGGRLC